MCQDCWDQYGSPQINSENVRLAASMAEGLDYSGALHIIIDDFNIENIHIDHCNCLELTEREKLFLDIFSSLTIQERASSLALAEGYWAAGPSGVGG
jgi:hypothetical protein